MATSSQAKFIKALSDRISNTKGVLASERPVVRRMMTFIASSEEAPQDNTRLVLLALQIAARDDLVWAAISASRAALGKL